MAKETDELCHICNLFDICEKEDSENCKEYEYYKCRECIDRLTESDLIPRCLRGNIPCNKVKYCVNNRK